MNTAHCNSSLYTFMSSLLSIPLVCIKSPHWLLNVITVFYIWMSSMLNKCTHYFLRLKTDLHVVITHWMYSLLTLSQDYLTGRHCLLDVLTTLFFYWISWTFLNWWDRKVFLFVSSLFSHSMLLCAGLIVFGRYGSPDIDWLFSDKPSAFFFHY